MLRPWKFLLLLLIMLSTAALAQDKPAAPPQPTPETQALLDVGFNAVKKYEWTAALQAFEKARDAAQKTNDVAGQALALHYNGSIYVNLGQTQKAVTVYQQALSLYRQIGNKNGESNVLGGIGTVYANTGQTRKASEFYQQSLSLYRQIGNKAGEAIMLGFLGKNSLKLGQTSSALQNHQQALALFKQIGDKGGEANALTNIGDVYINTGQPQKALDFYQQAVPLHQQTGNKFGEANALNNIGLVWFGTGQPQKALDSYQQAASLYKQVGSIVAEADTRNNIGIVYERLGQPRKALDIYQQMLVIFKQVGSKNRVANALENLGNTYVQMNQPEKALNFHRQALALYKQIGYKNEAAQTLNNIGNTYQDLEQLPKASEFYRQALLIHQQLKDKNGESTTLSNLGSVYSTLRQFPTALKYYEQAQSLFKQVGDKSGEAGLLAERGSIFVRLGAYRQAENSLQSAATMTEQLRGAIGGSAENRQLYLATMLPAYTNLVRVQVQLKEYDRAFATLNKMKARSLLDQELRTRHLLTTLPATEQSALRQQWREVDALSLSVVASERHSKQTQQAAQERLRIAERALQLEQDALSARYPEAQAQESKTLLLADTPKFLPADTALLEYVTLHLKEGKKRSERILLFVVTVDRGKPILTVHSLASKQTELAHFAEPFRQACAKPGHAYKPLARKLGALLLPAEVQKRLTGKKRLVVCPDGAVWSVPFAALLLPDGKHLLEHYEIDYAYSATGAQVSFTMPHHQAEGMLVLANPDFGDTSRFGDSLPEQIAEGTERPLSEPARPLSDPSRPLSEPSRLASILERGKIKPLPGTQSEANALAKFSVNTTFLTGKEAQEAELVKALPKYRYLHFATHGLFSDVSPLQSAIVLAAPPKDSAEDGFLTAREIAEMKLNAEMAVLSACETARGFNQEGEGVIGLTWALFAAGVPTQVVSQWKVSDASTPLLMAQFYGNLKRGETKGQSLRKAALSMYHDGKHSHPYHWAAFVLFGNWK